MKQASILLISIFMFCSLFSQKQRLKQDYLHEIRFTTENDNYLFTFHDGYYTNGVFLQYSYPSKWRKRHGAIKMISDFRLGQMIFVSEHFRNSRAERIDRPMSGYLYLEKGYRLFFKKGNFLHASASIGGTGKYSLAREVQSWYHEAMNLTRVRGWEYGLPGELSLNVTGNYFYNMLGVKNKKSCFEIMATMIANAGNAFTNAGVGTLFKFGNFEDPANSSFFNGRTGTTSGHLKRKAEIFVYVHPQIIFQLYNSTVQGPLFLKYKGDAASTIEPWVFLHQWGFHYAESKWTVAVEYSRKEKEATTMRQKREKFASLTVGYRFGGTKHKPDLGYKIETPNL